MTAAIRLIDLTRRYGAVAAVAGLNLEIPAGSITGLLGANGAGKTTTLAMLLRLVRPSSGRVLIGDYDVWQAPQAALRDVGALIEAPPLLDYLTASEHIRVWADYAGVPADPQAQLAQVGLADAAHQRVATFSQGMRQRLGLALALLGNPRLLILDEPTVGIDPRGVVAFRQTLRAMAAAGTTIIFSSHQLAEVQQLCDHVIVLDRGRCVAQGSVAELLGSGGRLLLRIEGDSEVQEAALELVRAWGGGTKARLLDGLIDALLPAEAAAPLNQALVAAGFAVAELRPQAPNLEDFFLHLTAVEAQ